MWEWFLGPKDIPLRGTCGPGFSPARWHCVFWSEIGYFVAYIIIAFIFMFLIRRRHHVSLHHIFWFLGLFIVVCGASHFTDAMLMLVPCYNLDALIRASGAIISLAAAVIIGYRTPAVMAIPPIISLYKEQQVLKGVVLELQNRIAEEAKNDPDRAMDMMERATQEIRKIKDERDPYA